MNHVLDHCIVCKSRDFKILYNDLQIAQCNCGHVFHLNDLDSKAVCALYQDAYFSGDEYADYKADKKVIQRNFSSRLSTVRKFSAGGAKLLEIGCAYGFFLELADKYYDASGIDITVPGIEHAKNDLKLNVTLGDFLEANFEENSFDVVCLFDCIEHLIRPDLFIQKISKILKPGGHIFITTGDVSSINARLRGENWRLIHPPTHLHYFSRTTLNQLLLNYGLSTVQIKYPMIWRSMNQTLTSILKTKNPIKSMPFCFPLNTFDVLEMVGKKGTDTK